MKDNNHFPQLPPGGGGRLRALLASLDGDQKQLDEDPRYQEGWDDGYAAAQQNHKRLAKAIANVYRIDEWSDQ